MEEFDKIKAFSESVAEREANLSADKENSDKTIEKKSTEDLDLPQYLSQFRPQLPEEKSENNLFIWMLCGLAFLLMIGVGGFFYFYAPKDDVNEIVVISPTPTPVKVRPQNPGGLKIAGTDKVVYNRTSAHKAEVVEKMFPEPEQPVLPPADQVVSVADVVESIPVPQEIDVVPIVLEGLNKATKPGEVMPETGEKAGNTSLFDVVPDEIVSPSEQVGSSEKSKKSVEDSKEKTQKSVETKKESVVEKKEVKGEWKAQLLSSSNKAKVESEWKTISKKHKALLSDMPYQITSVNIPGKGTFYRLQVGGFGTKEQANTLCAKLKAKKQDCIPVK